MKKFIQVVVMASIACVIQGKLFAEDQSPVKQSLVFVFRSPGTGIDTSIAKSIEAILGNLISNSKISNYRKLRWGHEGEFTICAQIEDKETFDIESYYLQNIVNRSDLMSPGAERKVALQIAENCDRLPGS